MLEKLARHWGLMNAMSRRAGVDLGAEFIDGRLGRSTLRGAVFACARCAEVPACEELLGRCCGAGSEIPAYCLNRDLILGLRARQPC